MRRATFPSDINLGFYGHKHTSVFLIWFITAFVVIWFLLSRFAAVEFSLNLNVFDLILLAFSLVLGFLLLKYTAALGNLLTLCCLAAGLYFLKLYCREISDTLIKLFECDSKLNLFYTLCCVTCLLSSIIAQLLKVVIRLFFLIPIKWFNHSYFLSLIRETLSAFVTAALLFFFYLFIIMTILFLVYNSYLSISILYNDCLASSPLYELFCKTTARFVSICLEDPFTEYLSLPTPPL